MQSELLKRSGQARLNQINHRHPELVSGPIKISFINSDGFRVYHKVTKAELTSLSKFVNVTIE